MPTRNMDLPESTKRMRAEISPRFAYPAWHRNQSSLVFRRDALLSLAEALEWEPTVLRAAVQRTTDELGGEGFRMTIDGVTVTYGRLHGVAGGAVNGDATRPRRDDGFRVFLRNWVCLAGAL